MTPMELALKVAIWAIVVGALLLLGAYLGDKYHGKSEDYGYVVPAMLGLAFIALGILVLAGVGAVKLWGVMW